MEHLAGDLWSVPVPIPNNPLRYTLSYLVPVRTGWLVVDPGWDTEAGWDALTAGLAAAGAGVGDVRGVVVTHVHPDHHGLSARLQQAGAWVAMHPAERDTLPQRTSTGGAADRRAAAERWLLRSGAPEREIAALLSGFPVDDSVVGVTLVEPDVLLEDGDLVGERRLRAVWTPGHTPGHLCLQDLEAGVLLTGDHVLPRISPNIGLHPGTDEPSLANFLASLDRVAHYDDHEALPAHEYRFTGLAARARDLKEHHARRCQEVLDVVADLDAPTLWQLAERLTWSRPWSEIGFMVFGALAETAAHVRYLADLGRIDWSGEPRSDNGSYQSATRIRASSG